MPVPRRSHRDGVVERHSVAQVGLSLNATARLMLDQRGLSFLQYKLYEKKDKR